MDTETPNTPSTTLNNKVYDVAKSVAMIWLPAIATLYFTLAQIWHLPAAEETVGTITAVDTFLGLLLGVSTRSYNSSDSKYDGTIKVQETDGKKIFQLALDSDPDDLDSKQQVLFKVDTSTSLDTSGS